MPAVNWSPRALADVQRLWRFIKDRNPQAASQAVRTIRAAAAMLSRHPEIGRTMDGMDDRFREWLIPFGSSGYAMIYRVDGDEVLILAVRHQREAGY
jgi:plasmid stabilization system protein ParE